MKNCWQNINKEAAKISAILSQKIDQYEYLTGEEILPPDQRRKIEKARFECAPLGKAIFMNSENSKKSDPRRLLLNLSGKLNWKGSDKYVALSNLSNYYTWKNIKKSYKNNKFKISAPTWDELFELPDVSYSISDI